MCGQSSGSNTPLQANQRLGNLMPDVAIEVDGLWKNFRMYHERNRYIKAALLRGRRARYEEFWALSDVTFSIRESETVGFIGANGSGKSTLLKCLTRIYQPNRGSIRVNGRTAALLELGAGFSPELTGRENIFLNGSILGMTRRDIHAKLDEIVEFAGLGDFLDSPVKNYSSGMTVRLGFSIAAHVDPRILLIDEVLSVGDQSFQQRSAEKIETFKREGRTIVVVSHSLGVIEQLCQRTIWLNKGRIRDDGASSKVVAAYSGGTPSALTQNREAGHAQWGTGEARLTSIRICDFADNLISHIDNKQPIRITLQLNSHVRLDGAFIRVSINSENGNCAWSTSTQHGKSALRVLDGPATAIIDVPPLRLSSGRYMLSASIWDATGTIELDHQHNWQSLQVEQSGIAEPGLLQLEATWRMRRD